jgi:hypothetical protein
VIDFTRMRSNGISLEKHLAGYKQIELTPTQV